MSDIDLVVVFRDNTNYPFNPRKNFDIIENYLFTHNPFGISESDFKRSQDYSFSTTINYYMELSLMLKII